MSGNVRGIVDCRPPVQIRYNCFRDAFKRFNDYFNTHPNVTRIALRRRNGVAGASSLGYWDAGASSWADGNTAVGSWHALYAVYRMNPSGSRSWPYYVAIWMHEATGQASPIFDATTATNTEVAIGISVAVGHGGDENPWNGTTVNDGTDAVPTTWWKIPTGGTAVSVLPGSNNTGYTHATNKQNFAVIFPRSQQAAVNISLRHGIMGDDDAFVIYYDDGDVGALNRYMIVAPYVPRTGITVSRPLMMLVDGPHSLDNDRQMGQSSGALTNSNYSQGGMVAPDSNLALASPREVVFPIAQIPTIMSNTAQPNFYTGKRELWPVTFRTVGQGIGDLTTAGGAYLGYVPATVMGATAGLNAFDLSLDKKTIFFGDNTPANGQMGFPFWDPNTFPRSTTTRGGVSFSRAP